jgi:hypothetical protein
MINFNSRFLFSSLLLISSNVFAVYPVIPLNTFQRPPADVVNAKNQPLSFADLAGEFQAGIDVSKYNPVENKFWQTPDKSLPALDPRAAEIKQNILKAGGVDYVDDVGGNREIGLYSVFVKAKNGTDRYGLTLGTQVHTSLLRSGLLRKLGYFQNSPVFFQALRLEFSSKEKKDEFISNAFCGQDDKVTASCISIDPFLSKDNPRTEPMLIHDGETALKLRSVYLEVFDNSIPSLIDGITPAAANNVNLFGANRSFRSLAAPFAVSELGESLNRVEAESVKLVDGKALILVNFGSDFGNTDHFDLRWILRKMADLEPKDWKAIIAAAQYPDQCLNQMAYNGLISRFQNIAGIMNINTLENQKDITKITVRSDVIAGVNYTYSCVSSIHGELVRNGNLTREFIKGSPIRFSHGLVDSPWGKGDYLRVALIMAQSGLLQTGLAKLTAKLKSQEASAVGRVVPSPDGPQVLATYEDKTVKGNVDASRVINTGTLMGSEAPVQMVDNLSISLGYTHSKLSQLAADVIRGASGRIRASRDFTYVKPIGSMKEASETSVLSVLKTHSKLKDLAKPIENGNISEFLRAMKKDEVFFITDTISLEGSYGINYGLNAIKMLGHVVYPSLSISLHAGYAVVGQTMFLRTEEGIQVIVRKLDPLKNRMISAGYTISVTALFEIFSFTNKITTAHYASDVYNINYDYEFMSNLCPRVFATMDEYKDDPAYAEAECADGQLNPENFENEELKAAVIAKAHGMKRFEKSALTALNDLIFDSNTRILEADKNLKQRKFQIKNKVTTIEKTLQQFWNRQIMMSENQVISFFDPILKDGTVNKGKPIQLAVSTRGALRGSDPVGFSLNVIDAIMKEKWGENAVALSQSVVNPSGMPKGTAEWRIAETQSEITDFGGIDGKKMPSMATLKYVWGGWSVKQAELNELITKVNQRVPTYVLNNVKFIPDGVFEKVDKVDFYRLIVSLKIEAGGLYNLKKLVVSPDVQIPDPQASVDAKRGFLKKLLYKINEKITGYYRPQDKLIFDRIVELYGKEQYNAECYNDAMAVEGPNPDQTQSTYAGTDYSCLSKWLERLIVVSRKFDEGKIERATEAITEILYILDEKLPIQSLLSVIGEGNYRYGVNVFGFRAKDENAKDANWQGPIFGEPTNFDEYMNSLTGFLSQRFKISPLVINRSQMQF